MSTLMEMKNINKSFGRNKVLEDVNLLLNSSEVLALFRRKWSRQIHSY
jgi:ABC-type sugar transport system ATPase subunit